MGCDSRELWCYWRISCLKSMQWVSTGSVFGTLYFLSWIVTSSAFFYFFLFQLTNYCFYFCYSVIICSVMYYRLYRYERILTEMLSHLERQPRNKDRRVAWLQHIEAVFNSLGLLLLAHFRRIFPLFFQWMREDDDETILLVRHLTMCPNVFHEAFQPCANNHLQHYFIWFVVKFEHYIYLSIPYHFERRFSNWSIQSLH